MADYAAMSDADLMALVQPKQATADYSKMSDAELLKTVQPKIGLSDIASSAWKDIKKAATNVAGSVYSGVTLPRDVITGNAQLPSSGAVPGSVEFGDPNSAGGRVADMAMLATPLSPAARAGEAAIPGVTKAAVTEKAATPSLAEIDAAATGGFNKAKNMGVDIAPSALSDIGSKVERKLQGMGIHEEHAPQTYKTLDRLANPPEGAVSTISDLHNLRQSFGNAADNFSFPKDKVGASIGKDAVDELMAAFPEKAVLAGRAPEASAILKDAIGNSAAAFRAKDFDARLTKAERATDRQIAGSLDSQIRSKAGGLLDSAKASRGLNAEEIAQLDKINGGPLGRNILRQLGRGGAGVVPMGAHAITAYLTGGASILPSLAIGGPLYAARKIAESLTKKEARKLDEMLRARSPLAESRTPITRELTGGEQGMRGARVRAIAEMLNAQGQR